MRGLGDISEAPRANVIYLQQSVEIQSVEIQAVPPPIAKKGLANVIQFSVEPYCVDAPL